MNKNMKYFDWRGFRRKHNFTDGDFKRAFNVKAATNYISMSASNNISVKKLNILVAIYGNLDEFICDSEKEVIMRGL